MIIQKLARAGAHPRPPWARQARHASIYADSWTAIYSESTAQPLKQWPCGDCAPTMPTIDAVLLGAVCGMRIAWPTHQRIMICLCVCTVKTVNGDEMNHSRYFQIWNRVSKYGTAPGVGLLFKFFALIRSHIHSRKLFLHCVCSVFMRVATHCYNY